MNDAGLMFALAAVAALGWFMAGMMVFEIRSLQAFNAHLQSVGKGRDGGRDRAVLETGYIARGPR